MEELTLPGGRGKLTNGAPQKTILIFSPDLNLCFCLSLLFQDRYHVVTTTSLAMLDPLAAEEGAELIIVDAVPSECLIKQLDEVRAARGSVPVIVLYAYNARTGILDRTIRSHVDAVFYKPVEIAAVTTRIEELLTV